MKVIITGGTGFIGRYIIPSFFDKNYEVIVLTRYPERARKILPNGCEIISKLDTLSANIAVKGILNLAGEPIDKGRWTPKKKKELIASRVRITQQCVDLVKRLNEKPAWLVSGSAIGFYGAHQNEMLDEHSKPNPGFTHELCRQWEQCVLQAQAFGVRVCLLRTGVVLGRNGGALARMLPPFKWGLGGRLGHGHQWFSWVHQEDLCRIIHALIDNESLSGAFNGTSPNPVTNRQLTQNLAKALHRPVFFPVPAFVIKWLYGEMGTELLLKGQRVIPKKMLDIGFQFQFPDLGKALDDILHSK